jgi:phenylacetate-CoA ligase
MRSIGEKLYLALPAFRNVGATVKGLIVNRDRYGNHYRAATTRIADRECWTNEQMVEYQTHRLREIIDIADHHVPYYRKLFCELGLSSNDIKTAKDLKKLPILEKDSVRVDPLRFVDERLNPRDLLKETTTGTTGTPIRVLMTRRARQEHYAFFETRCRRVAGLRFGQDAYVTFGVKHVVALERTVPPFWCYNYAGEQLYMSVYHLAPQYLRHYTTELKKRPYKALMGYPSAISTLARYILDEDIHDIEIPVVISSGETLHLQKRDEIERAFKCQVFDQFGCAEMSVFAAELTCGRMHVSPDYGIVEIVDDSGHPLPPGIVGHLVCTGLVNDAQILLRYRIGDIASLGKNLCNCGNPLPVMESLNGRAANAIILPDGRKMFRMNAIDAEIPSIAEYQIVQEEIGVFTIYIVVSEAFNNGDKEELVRNLAENVGHAKITVEVVNRIERGPGGKFASVTSKVSAREGSFLSSR